MMNFFTSPTQLFAVALALIATFLWWKIDFKKTWKKAKTSHQKIRAVLTLIGFGLIGGLTGVLLQNLYTLFVGINPLILAGTTFIALLPVLIWIQFIYEKRLKSLKGKKSKDREKWILLSIFLLGALTLPLINLFYEFLYSHPELNYYDHLTYTLTNPTNYKIVTTVIDALLEEIVKISLMIFFIRSLKLIRTIGDAIAFSVLSGLGFAFIENIVFFIDIYLDTTKNLNILLNVMIFRTIVLSIGHMTFSGIFGYFYGLSKFALPVYEEEHWEGIRFPFFERVAKLLRTSTATIFGWALMYEGLILAMITHAAFNNFIAFNQRDYAIYLVLATSLYVYYLTQRKAGHMVLASLGQKRMSMMAPRDEDVILELAGMWIQEGKYKEVEEICQRLEQRDPDNAVIKLLYAKAHDKRRVKRAMLALESLFFQEDIFEEDISLFEKFQQKKAQAEAKKRVGKG